VKTRAVAADPFCSPTKVPVPADQASPALYGLSSSCHSAAEDAIILFHARPPRYDHGSRRRAVSTAGPMSSRMAERLGAMANPSPIQLAGLAFNRFFFITSFVPLGFVLIKLTNLEILKPALTDSIAPVLGLVWPVFPSQYEALRTLGSEQDASNYVLFFLCLFSLGALFLPSFVTDCVSNRKLIRNWSWREIIFALILLCISSGIVFLDTPKLNPKPIWNFYVDAFGLYYLRQYAIFMTVYLTILVIVAWVVVLADRTKK
jgi:hypothetical protein